MVDDREADARGVLRVDFRIEPHHAALWRQVRPGAGLHAVLQEIEQKLLEHHAVAHHEREVFRHMKFDRALQFPRLNVGELERFLNDGLHGHGLELRIGLPCKSADALNDAARALGLIFNAREALRLALLRERSGGEHRGGGIGVVGDGGKGLVELVRERTRHLAHRHEAVR